MHSASGMNVNVFCELSDEIFSYNSLSVYLDSNQLSLEMDVQSSCSLLCLDLRVELDP